MYYFFVPVKFCCLVKKPWVKEAAGKVKEQTGARKLRDSFTVQKAKWTWDSPAKGRAGVQE